MARILIAADTQNPFEHQDYLDFLKYVSVKYRCDTFVHVGDETDQHCLGNYDNDPDGYSAGHELLAAIEHLKPYYKAFPVMKLCTSNHSARIIKRAFKSGIPQGYLRNFKEAIGAPKGWQWADYWEIDNILFIHGLGYSGSIGALNAAKDKFKSCVIGHLHADAGILYFSNGKEVIWGMNVGSGIDANAYAFRYGKDCRKKPIISCGVIVNGQPHLIIMKMDKNGRWVGDA